MAAHLRLVRIERDTLWDRAHASLKDALLAGRFAPGQRIVLRDVADSLGISLTPVRDAVNRLVAERILERGGVGQGGGATVPMLDAEQFSQLMAIRVSLEAMATEAAASRITPTQLDAVEGDLHEMKRSVEEHRIDDYLAAHHRFHFGIYAACGNPILIDMIEGVWLRCGPALTLALPEYVPSLKRYKLHAAACAALKRRDGERAAAAIRADIESAAHDLGAMLERMAPRS